MLDGVIEQVDQDPFCDPFIRADNKIRARAGQDGNLPAACLNIKVLNGIVYQFPERNFSGFKLHPVVFKFPYVQEVIHQVQHPLTGVLYDRHLVIRI